MTAYEQGFFTKCAEYGIAPEWLASIMEKDAKVRDAKQIYDLVRRWYMRSGRRALASGKNLSEATRIANRDAAKAVMGGKNSKKGVEDFIRQAYSESTRGRRPLLETNSTQLIRPGVGTGGQQLVRNGFGREVSKAIESGKRTAKAPAALAPTLGRATGAAGKRVVDRVGNSALAYSGDKPAVKYVLDKATPTASSAVVPTASSPTAAASKLSPFGRFLELLGGGNRNAREYKRLLESGAANEKQLSQALARAQSAGDTVGFAHMNQVGNRMRGFQSAAEEARRLQGADSELQKVLATRIGTGVVGAGALGIPIVAASQPDTYASNNPWHQLNV